MLAVSAGWWSKCQDVWREMAFGRRAMPSMKRAPWRHSRQSARPANAHDLHDLHVAPATMSTFADQYLAEFQILTGTDCGTVSRVLLAFWPPRGELHRRTLPCFRGAGSSAG